MQVVCFMLLCMLHMFYMLLASNIFMFLALIATNWLMVIFNMHFLFFYICLVLVLCALIRFYSPIHIGPMMVFVFDVIISRTNAVQLSYSFCGIPYDVQLIHYTQYIASSFVSTWLKAVIPSVLAGRWHVSLIFLTQISVSIQITYSFSDWKGVAWRTLAEHKEWQLCIAVADTDISEEYIPPLCRWIFLRYIS